MCKMLCNLLILTSKNVIVPHSTDTQSLARDTPLCARSTLDINVSLMYYRFLPELQPLI